MRLPNGYGSVYKLSGNRRKPWIARKTVGWTKKGKQKYYTIGYFETRKEGLTALAEYNKNPIGIDRDITLKELWEKWYYDRFANLSYEEREKTRKTAETYYTAWNHLSEIGDMMVRDIKTSHLQAVIRKMEREKNLGHSSCQKVKVLQGILMKLAMSDDIIDVNYAEMVEVSSRDKSRHAEVFTELELKTLENNAHVEWVDTILMFIYTGMRIGELLALTKFNINLEEMLITGGAKTDAGKDRIIPIHPKIQKFVKKWYEKESTHFITRNGKPIRPGYYRPYLYYPALEKLEIRRLTPHKARHTFATMLQKADVDLKTRQMLLGHSDVATTMRYTHPDIEVLRRGIALI